jgi:hypothetical protein
MTNQTHPQEVPELVERLRAIQSEALADAFNPDMRSAARLVFEAQEKLFHLLPEILAALTKAAPPVEGALREAVNSAVATLMAVRATASDLDEWRGAADHFSDLCARETRKLNAALQQSRSTPAPVAGNAIDAGTALEALSWFSTQHNLELFRKQPVYGDDDDDQTDEWQVTRVNGGINDREWTVIGRGETAAEALRNALSSGKTVGAGEGGDG